MTLTAKRTWDAVKGKYLTPTTKYINDMQVMFDQLTKGDSTVEQFEQQLWLIAEERECLGVSIGEKDIMMKLLSPKSKFPAEFKSTIDSLACMRDNDLAHTLQTLVAKEKDLEEETIIESASAARGKTEEQLESNEERKAKWLATVVCHKCGKKAGHLARDCKDQPKTTAKQAKTFSEAEMKAEVTRQVELAMKAFNKPAQNYLTVDTAASSTMVPDSDALHNIISENPPKRIYLADDGFIEAKQSGDMNIVVQDMRGNDKHITLAKVLHAPELESGLLSVKAITKLGITCTFGPDGGFMINDKGERISKFEEKDNLYLLPLQIGGKDRAKLVSEQPGDVEAKEVRFDIPDHKRADGYTSNMNSSFRKAKKRVISKATSKETELWHRRLGHLGIENMKRLLKEDMVTGIPHDSWTKDDCHCEGCMWGRQARKPFKHDDEKDRGVCLPGEEIHTDLWGPARVAQRHTGKRYSVRFLDRATRYSKVYHLKYKSEQFKYFKVFKAASELETGNKVKRVQSDRGGEYLNGEAKKYMEEHGITVRTSPSRSPQMNGRAERLNRTAMDKSLSMLHMAGLHVRIWVEAVDTATYLMNISPIAGSNITPYEAWHGRKPQLKDLKVFGCDAWRHIHKDLRENGKLGKKSAKQIFVGYALDSKCYKLMDPSTGKITESRDVEFDESSFQMRVETQIDPSLKRDSAIAMEDEVSFELEHEVPEARTPQKPKSNDSIGRNPLPRKAKQNVDYAEIEQETEEEVHEEAVDRVTYDPLGVTVRDANGNLMYPARFMPGDIENRRLTDLPEVQENEEDIFNQQDFVTWTDETGPPLAPNDINRGPLNPSRRMQAKVAKIFAKLTNLIDIPEEPIRLKDAMSGPFKEKWKESMRAELEAHKKNHTWDLVEREPNMNVIQAKWVYKIKVNEKGEISKFKSRLVGRGDMQSEGVDYKETFAPVARMNSIRLTLAMGAILDLEIHSMDVVTAYLNGDLEEEIYMVQPPGFREDGDNRVCRLRKGLYGLKQAGRVWHKCLLDYLKSIGFTPLAADSCIYLRVDGEDGKDVTILDVSTDDLIIMGNNMDLVNVFKTEMKNRFEMTDQGELVHHLGMEIIRDRQARTLMLNQEVYINNLLKRYGMMNAKPAKTPTAHDAASELVMANCPSTKEDIAEMDSIPFRQAIGSLTYLTTCTRPDIAAALGSVSKFVSNPGMAHWSAVKRIMRYIKGTSNYGLKLGGTSEETMILDGYADSDWAGDQDDRRSRTGYIFQLNGSTITWCSRRQPTVANSSMEAEYMGAHGSTMEALWIRKILAELRHAQKGATVIKEDNQGCIALTKNDVMSSKMKHIQIKYHATREQVQAKRVAFQYCHTSKNLADIMTKGLPQKIFERLRDEIGVVPKDELSKPSSWSVKSRYDEVLGLASYGSHVSDISRARKD
jgi:hypothetical protein